MTPYILSSSILSANFAHLQDEITTAEKSGIDWIHCDVMDGHFVPNLTMGPFIIETCSAITRLPLDCHLMVNQPENLVDAFVKAGATHITIHPENNPLVQQTLEKIRSSGCKAGLAINPETSADVLSPLLSLVDLVLVMTVHPGYSGQKFMPEVLPKLREVAGMIRSLPVPPILEVDGGITAQNIAQVRDAGANAFVSASAIFHYPQGIGAGIASLREALAKSG